MSQKFHISPKVGPAKCSAKAPESCDFRGSPHFDTMDEAVRVFEVEVRKSRQSLAKVSLADIMDTDMLRDMVEQGYVASSRHPDDDSLQVLSYSRSTQFEGRWNDVTNQARGLIIQSSVSKFSDAVVVERPWRKFFTIEQMSEGPDGKRAWALGDEDDGPGHSTIDASQIDFHAPAEVTDKLDGSLGILYRAPDGQLALSTKGSFTSDQAVEYTKFLRENEAFYQAAENLKKGDQTTHLFELVGPDNPIVLNYDKQDIVLLGGVDKSSGVYRSPEDFKQVWGESQGLSRTEIMPAKNLHEALAMGDRENREGMVVRFKSNDPNQQVMVKIKQEDYLKLHRVSTALTPKRVLSLITEGDFEQVREKMSTPIQERMDAVKEDFDKLEGRARETYEKYAHIESQKDFALTVQKEVPKSLRSLMFSLRQGKDIREQVASIVERLRKDEQS